MDVTNYIKQFSAVKPHYSGQDHSPATVSSVPLGPNQLLLLAVPASLLVTECAASPAAPDLNLLLLLVAAAAAAGCAARAFGVSGRDLLPVLLSTLALPSSMAFSADTREPMPHDGADSAASAAAAVSAPSLSSSLLLLALVLPAAS
jgi:hypothetical protein